MPHQSHPLWSDQPSNILWTELIQKFLMKSFSEYFSRFIVRPNVLSSTIFQTNIAKCPNQKCLDKRSRIASQIIFITGINGKTIPVQAWISTVDSRRFRLPGFSDNRHMKVVGLSALCTGRLYPRWDPWSSFLLEAKSTPAPQCGRKN